MHWHKKGRKKENDMKGKGIVSTAVGLAMLGVTIFVVGFAFQKGKERAGK
jgi:transketolase C-terminal domain/subunit|tara:strand:- start:559 stop:708 length:150 start_codon:yes stop_codon:yes gene_type:complete